MKCIEKRISLTGALLAAMLLVLFGGVCLVNLSGVPGFYDSDMYTDIRYAMEAWKHGSIFPEGWVFGNQLYAVSTPVLAALLFGMTGKPLLAMGLASTVMAALVLLSFSWMLRPVVRSREGRLAGCVLFLSVVLFYGDAWQNTGGWQLLFTMCSYYACYAVNVFLAYGCYLRSGAWNRPGWVAVLVLTCVLSFGTGIQSLRQTAVMTLPLCAAELLRILQNAAAKKPLNKSSLTAAALVTASNLAGLVTARCLNIQQVEIFGELGIAELAGFLPGLRGSILLALSLVMNHDPVSFMVLAALALVCGAAALRMLITAIRKREGKALTLFGLLLLSVLAIVAVDVLTTMQVRAIYYFMLFPLLAFLTAVFFDGGGKWGRAAVSGLLAVLFLLSFIRGLVPVCGRVMDHQEESAYVISDYLMEQGYTTLYASWNRGADVAIASDWEITAGFWEYDEDPFFYYKYLCNPEVFTADPEHCAYLFYGEEYAQLAIDKAGTKGIDLKLLTYFPQWDAYLYTAPVNIMEAFG